jgi:hypothetical protein
MAGAEKLLKPVVLGGEAIVDEKNVRRIQEYARRQIAEYGKPGRVVELSASLRELSTSH